MVTAEFMELNEVQKNKTLESIAHCWDESALVFSIVVSLCSKCRMGGRGRKGGREGGVYSEEEQDILTDSPPILCLMSPRSYPQTIICNLQP